MTKITDNNLEDSHDEEQFAQLMRGVGKRAEIPDGTQERMERHFRTELAKVKTRKRRMVRYALAATIVIGIGVALNLEGPPPSEPVAVATIAESIGTGYWQNNGVKRNLTEGTLLSVGDTFSTAAGLARLTLTNSNIDLRINEHTKLTFSHDQAIYLEEGSIYVDASGAGTSQFVVKTRLGSVEHIGTQYMVTTGSGLLNIAVREGEVRYEGDAGPIFGHATQEGAELITVNGAGAHSTQVISPVGDAWRWVNKVSPEFSTNGKSLLAILHWFARETGRKVEFVTLDMRLDADLESIHGDLPTDDLDQFIQNIVSVSDGFVIGNLDDEVILIDRKHF